MQKDFWLPLRFASKNRHLHFVLRDEDILLQSFDLTVAKEFLAAVDRLKAKDFARTLLGFVDQIRSLPRTPLPAVTFDFWQQFDAAQELEELRLYRPAIYKALPV